MGSCTRGRRHGRCRNSPQNSRAHSRHRAREAVGEDAVFQVFAKGLAHKGARCVVVALAVERACAGQRMPSLEVLGYCAVQQRSLGVTRVVELGCGC